ncbi:hypothetical protein [Agrobacterium sp. lyk4-40-TYG-31]|uniref:hypothetical protein n=1 Tax=Agrobacterium sp. lyk4-40-TYG-31 TaxID=3040276 RepID=UPI0025500E0E|nr:hypothetical protein [Agrobacterium sp. lyk4-40-TYG-31]
MVTAIENASMSELSFFGEQMVRAILTVDDTDYECVEYVDDGMINDSADSHMNVNGIYDIESRRSVPFVEGGMYKEDYLRWEAVEKFVRHEMQSFVDEYKAA